jgi:hypothetical protein
MKKSVCLPFFILLSLTLFEQDSAMTVSQNKFLHIDFGVGYMKTDLGSINRSITGLGYKPLSEDFLTLSISTGFFVNRILIRNEVNILLPNTTRQGNNLTTSFRGRTVGVGIGYAIIEKPKLRLYPFVNVTAFVSRLDFEDNSPVEDMNGVINTPHYSSRLYFSNASFDAGLQMEKVIDRKPRKWDCPQSRRFTTVGVRLGYSFGPGTVKGRYNGMQSIADAPSYTFKGPYAKVIWGFGSKMRELKWKK